MTSKTMSYVLSKPAQSISFTNREKSELLSRYTKLEKLIERRMEELVLLRSFAERVTPVYHHTPNSPGFEDKLPSLVEQIVQINEEINAQISHYLQLRRQIADAISQVGNELYQVLLEYRYLNGCTWEQVASKMHYSYVHINRLHDAALTAVPADSLLSLRI